VFIPNRLLFLFAVSAALLAVPAAAQAGTGVIVDRGRATPARAPYVHVFDPGSMQITGSVALPLAAFAQVFDVEITPDLGTAFVGDFLGNSIWVVDLTTNPPSLATGINPIPITGPFPQDLVLTPNGRFLLAATGNNLPSQQGTGSGLSVVDVASRTQVEYVDFSPNSPTAVEAGPDGSILVAELVVSQPSYGESNVRRFKIDAQGQLTDTGDVAGIAVLPGVQNLLVPSFPFLPPIANAHISRQTVHVARPAGQVAGSLRTAGLSLSETVPLANPTGIDLCFDPWRAMLFVRTNELGVSGAAGVGNSRIDGFFFHPVTGQWSQPVVTIALERRAGTAFGVEQTAVDPVTRRLFVSGLANGEVRVFDSVLGTQVATITHPDFLWGVGINVRRRW